MKKSLPYWQTEDICFLNNLPYRVPSCDIIYVSQRKFRYPAGKLDWIYLRETKFPRDSKETTRLNYSFILKLAGGKDGVKKDSKGDEDETASVTSYESSMVCGL